MALLIFYLIFVIGIKRTESEAACTIMSFFIQYSALVAMSWMCAEAVLMLKTLVFDVLHVPSKKFLIITSVICWGKKNL